jgi:NAD(P)H-dependent flavin oxidoreductase YrpB (nitropropane dioxygenase family)
MWESVIITFAWRPSRIFSGMPHMRPRPRLAVPEIAGACAGYIDDGGHKELNVSGDTELIKMWRDVWSAGHGVGGVTRIARVREEVERLVHERAGALKGLAIEPASATG